MSEFGSGGGKAIIYNGYHDPHITAFDTIQSYEELSRYDHRIFTDQYVRAFLVQGMDHCGGPKGPIDAEDRFLDALISWVEEGKAPDSVVASRPERTYLLCPEPYASVYDGRGDVNDAEDWSCVRRPRISRCGNTNWSPFNICPAQGPDRGVSFIKSR